MTRDTVRQFGPLAQQYSLSESHAMGRTLALLLDRSEPQGCDVALDIATGAGHTALAFAPVVRRVVATDLTYAMVAQTLAAARSRGLGNVRGVVCPAERLPFANGRFDLATCRTAAHHFDDPEAFLREARRVLRPHGRLTLSDQEAASDPALRELQHRVEVLHDATHRRTWTQDEWRAALERAGFRNITVEGGASAQLTELPEPTNVALWCARSRTPADAQAEIVGLLRQAPRDMREALGVGEDCEDLVFRIYKFVATAVA